MARDDKTTGRSHDGDQKKPVVIKKYANRRLYNTATSSYVTLDHLCQMVKDDVDFAVYDAKTGEDITRSVLTQIIVEEESKGTNLLPINFLRQLIGFYGDNMQAVVPSYLEHMMQAFAANQDRMRAQMRETMSGMFPFGGDLQKMSEQNAALFDSALKMFTPFGAAQQGAAPAGEDESRAGAADVPANQQTGGQDASEETLKQLKQQVDLLQQQLDVLTRQQQGAAPGNGVAAGPPSGGSQPAPGAAGASQSGMGQSGTGQSGAGQSGTGQSGTGQPASGQPGSGQNGAPSSGTGQTGSGKAGAAKSGGTASTAAGARRAGSRSS
jgi:polyhydroxyalkanoate synthesis repressor PhaR